VSHTTRAPREGEEDGVHYHFVDEGTFADMVAASGFAEHATVYGKRYGTSRAEIARIHGAGLHALLDIDVQGARQLREVWPDSVAIFLLPPSLADLADRLKARRTETEEQARVRLMQARAEIEQYSHYDYVVVNDRVDDAVGSVLAILAAEQSRVGRSGALAERVLAGERTGPMEPPLQPTGTGDPEENA
jgi:guanylate kinase